MTLVEMWINIGADMLWVSREKDGCIEVLHPVRRIWLWLLLSKQPNWEVLFGVRIRTDDE